MIRREEKLITKYYYIRAFGLAIINAAFIMDCELFFISVLRAGCNEIELNIVNCGVSRSEKIKKKKVKIKTENEKIVETIWIYGTKHV